MQIKTTTINAVTPAIITPIATLPSGQYSGIQDGGKIVIPQHSQPPVRELWDVEFPNWEQVQILRAMPHYTIPFSTIRGIRRVVVISVAGVVTVTG